MQAVSSSGTRHVPYPRPLALMGNAASAGTLTVGCAGAKTGRQYLEGSGVSSVPVQINATIQRATFVHL